MERVEEHPLFSMLGAKNIPVVDASDANRVRETYFQAIMLHTGGWVPLPINGTVVYTQIHDCILEKFPATCHLVTDLMPREDAVKERAYFDDYIITVDIRNGNYVFIAKAMIPEDLVVAMKLVANSDNTTVVLPNDEWLKEKNPGMA